MNVPSKPIHPKKFYVRSGPLGLIFSLLSKATPILLEGYEYDGLDLYLHHTRDHHSGLETKTWAVTEGSTAMALCSGQRTKKAALALAKERLDTAAKREMPFSSILAGNLLSESDLSPRYKPGNEDDC
jgi:hypothetical protein